MVKNKKINLKKAMIAVVFGGKSKERSGSLVSGKTVFESLKKQGFNVYPVDPADEDALRKLEKADVAFLILHGKYGEDGKIQGYLENLGILYTGSGVLASALGMDKYHFKDFLKSAKIPTPRFVYIGDNQLSKKDADEIGSRLGLPLFLKPVSEGGSLGASIIKKKSDLRRNLKKSRAEGYDKYIIEEYIKGRAMTVGLLELNGKLKVLPVLETIPKKEFYDYEAKHDESLHFYKCPAPMKKKTYMKIQDLASNVYQLLGCYGFCRVDFMLNERNQPYVIEVNTLPGMSPHSNMATMAEAAGISYDELVVLMLKSAFNKPDYLP